MAQQFSFAGFWVRLFAGFLDFVCMLPVVCVLIYFFGISDYQLIQLSNDSHNYQSFFASAQGNTADLISYGVSIVYLTYFISKRSQATLGKRMMGVYVGNPDGSRLTFRKSLLRALASLLTSATLGLGFLIVAFTKEKTALHDLLCRTRVFYGKK